jgi:hypothetical protein
MIYTHTIMDNKLILAGTLIRNYKWKYYNGESQCKICWDNLNVGLSVQTPCYHKFHLECILTNMYDYKNIKCPDCNYDFSKHNKANNDNKALILYNERIYL